MLSQTSLKNLKTLAIFTGLSICSLQGTALAKTANGKAAEAPMVYNQPPKEILDVMRASSPPVPYMNPTRDKVLLVAMQYYPSIEGVAVPFLRLAGFPIVPTNDSKHDTPGGYGIPACARSFDLVNIASCKQISIAMNKLSCAGWPTWSADGKHFVLENRTSTAVELWIGDAQTGRMFKAPGVKLNQMFGSELQWMPDQKTLLVKLVPKSLGSVPVASATPIGPSIQESSGEKGQSSTYEKRDTLNNKYDEELFNYYGTSQLALIDIRRGVVTLLAETALFDDVEASPDGNHVLVSKIVKPYSYLTTYGRFPKRVEVLDISKPQKISRSLIADLPLADRVPVHGVPMGPRNFSWRPTDSATLIWAEALDSGDWNTKVPARDKVMLTRAPFKSSPIEIFRTEQRFGGFDWFEKPNSALLTEYDINTHWERTFIVNVDDPTQAKQILWDHSSDERYADPGSPVHKVLSNGFYVIRRSHDSMFLVGAGASPSGDRPFLDRLDLKTLKSERLFRSDKNDYEKFLAFDGLGENTFLTWHQSQDDVPNMYKRTLGESVKATEGEATIKSTRTALTHIADPTPQVRQIKKRLVKYKRADGLDLSFTLYTPPGYKEGTRVPTILYAYPLDYADASKAGQVTGSQATFTRLRDYRLLLMAGYAIIDQAAFPIVGDPKKAYDNYMDQLVSDAKAAIDEAVKMGVADPERIGVTGHSHGALMTVNLLAHSNFFRAGVATSGSYNKTLTPFGFQSERRSVWEAPEVYQKVSPFFYADKLKTPLLIVHGADDANPGTTPMQANFLYEAIRGNGGTARLVILPHEPHWYTARESNEQEIYEMLRWFDQYVKNAPARQVSK